MHGTGPRSKLIPKTRFLHSAVLGTRHIPPSSFYARLKSPCYRSNLLSLSHQQVNKHSLNTLLFMSDFNTEPSPIASNVLACSSTGLIHYIQIANQHLSLILPTYNITNGGRNPDLIPPLLKTFLESVTYTKLGYGAYEDAMRVKDQYGITCKNVLDIHWMAKVIGVGSINVGMLHDVFSEPHDIYLPGRINSNGQVSQSEQKEPGTLIDPRRWDWESHGSIELSRELIRCIAQDAFTSLRMYDNILVQKFRHGYQPLLTDPIQMTTDAKKFLLTSVPRGTVCSYSCKISASSFERTLYEA
ncbi:hypothetical protein BCR41DRAFT_150838 [Lobosporangium transversale]|uniref:Uncharacterized protein n=1 Tax=Lobosporangium transversale TaxID=64571 RepID=A0A1Y2GDY7_9FUNG|nr:hypothetical protein BCR41DRAFT_150838 [Lobosporangium transversale]ORZ08073.1 hypothetical protein BCR41DRAFT_150838 [Lobosporangium transversale]|eukprot:XP_021878307.1 hypothetical protein BCR41DRAFT_150838 [Lobosporangium transversale]